MTLLIFYSWVTQYSNVFQLAIWSIVYVVQRKDISSNICSSNSEESVKNIEEMIYQSLVCHAHYIIHITCTLHYAHYMHITLLINCMQKVNALYPLKCFLCCESAAL